MNSPTNKRPQDQTVNEWLGDYEGEGLRIHLGANVNSWVDCICAETEKQRRIWILSQSPKEIQDSVKRGVLHRWRKK